MEELKLTPTAGWTVTQPWRGIFGLAVTLGFALTMTATFDIQTYLGFFTTLIMSNVPILVIMGLGWQGQYPPTEGLPQPWRAILLTTFLMLIGVLACLALVNFIGDGVAQPFINVQSIITVIVTFFLVIAFGMWPFGKMSLAARGFLTLILAYILAWLLLKLFNFSMLSFPQGINPSPIGAVPFYAEGGPLAPFAALAPMGPIIWESAIDFFLWMVLFLFVFVAVQMWPFHKFPKLMQQPVMGIVLTLSCAVLALIAHFIGVEVLKMTPLRFLLVGVSYLFGILMFILMFQMWPGRMIKSPVGGGFVNLLLAIVVAIIAYYTIRAFCGAHFDPKAFHHPNDVFAMANVMLGLTFPAWAAYAGLWDFWPLPPTPAPPGPQ